MYVALKEHDKIPVQRAVGATSRRGGIDTPRFYVCDNIDAHYISYRGK